MAKYNGPKCRICRREGEKLFLKGQRCYTNKCAFDRRSYVPGQHGQGFRRRPSDYKIHLREKQKVRSIYGVLEKQFRKYYKIADSTKGVTGINLLNILESRLDNVVYRMGFAPSRSAARQFVKHGHILVDGNKVDIPSFNVDEGMEISVKQKSRNNPLVLEAVETASSEYSWLEVDKDNFKGKFISKPEREEIPLEIDERLIVEFYSK